MTEVAWAAGFYDGEGCTSLLCFAPYHRNWREHRVAS